MNDVSPVAEDYGQEELFEALVERADAYTDDWDPHSRDVGRTLLRIFATFERDVRKRLNEVPDKHLLAFLDALNFDRRPPQAARAAVSFDVSPDLDRNVPIPGGTRALADPGTGGSRQFELPRDGGFEATPARPAEIVGVDPTRDRIVDHGAVLAGESETLLDGDDLQSHALYLGDETALDLAAGATFTVTLDASGEADLFEATVWEYYGEDESGDEGWHRLSVPALERSTDDDVGVEALRERVRESAVATGPDVGPESAESRTFQLPGRPVPREIDGRERLWLRCSLPDGSKPLASSVSAVRIHVATSDRDDALAPDMLLSNDVPLSAEDGPLHPFGQVPQPPDTFFVACREPFTKPGSQVAIEFTPTADASASADAETDADSNAATSETDAPTPEIGMGVLDGPPRLSWEYWNGEGWTRIQSVSDETDSFREPGTVRFDVPEDMAATTVSGHENVWIRARLVGGNYGTPAYDGDSDATAAPLVDAPNAPAFEDVTVHYERADQSFDALLRRTNASYSENLAARSGPFTPFVTLPDERQTVYFGFDGALEDGPISLFLPVEDTTYPQSFDPGVQWEYCVDPTAFEWEKLDVRDQTGGLTERGIVMLTFPSPTAAFELFDRECHWIRARVTKDEFDAAERAQPPNGRVGDSERDGALSDSVPADATTERTTDPPTLEGIYPNTQWAYNKITVEDEVLGSSDGSHDQTFTCAQAPVIDVDVWVDELATLSAGERRRLAERRPADTTSEYDSRGEITAFWVRWTAVDDFLDSGPQDRHYVVNRTLGAVQFGSGDTGAIPPGGQDNVRATYTTGGGSEGDVAAGTITDLKSSIALIDGVSNPVPADGGADVESTEPLVTRATNRLKHRDRAVTARDYEAVAKAAFPELARVSCDTDHSPDGRSVIRVLIVPQTDREKPVPSMELKHQIRETLYDHAPASVAADDRTDVVVRGPGYSELAVTATVSASDVKSVSVLKADIERRLDEYLHPLGGNDGAGWRGGELPTSAALADVVADVDDVSEVVHFEATFDVAGDRRSVGVHDDHPALPEDTLVCSGDHRLTVTMAEE